MAWNGAPEIAHSVVRGPHHLYEPRGLRRNLSHPLHADDVPTGYLSALLCSCGERKQNMLTLVGLPEAHTEVRRTPVDVGSSNQHMASVAVPLLRAPVHPVSRILT